MRKYIKYMVYGIMGIIFISFPMSVPTIKSSTEYSIFNSNWDGCSELGKLMHQKKEVRYIITPEQRYDKNGVLFIISPNMHYSEWDVEKIRNFLDRGNIVVIVDDFGTANDVLNGLNIPKRISNKRAHDLFYLKNSSLIVTPNIQGFDNKITMNIPSYITSDVGQIKTSSVSNKIIMDEINYSNGKIIIISEPDIFINGMKKYNNEFWEYFLDNLNGEVVYIDELHHSGFDTYDIGVVYVHNNIPDNFKYIVFVMIVLGVYLLNNINIEFIYRKFRKNGLDLEKIAKENNLNKEKLEQILSKIREGRNYEWK